MLSLYTIFFIILCATSCLIYYYLTRKHNYWKKRKVLHIKPSSVFGNYLEYVFLQRGAPEIAHDMCLKFPNEPYFGAYYGSDPVLIVKDPELLKLIFVKDFYYFNMREIADHTHKEFTTKNMFFSGGDRWKVIRQNVTPLFSTTKLKNMFYIVENCAKAMEKAISDETKDSKVVEIRSLLARYTMDCIGSCAFGVNTRTLEKNYETNPFTIIGKKILETSNFGGLKLIGRAMWPSIFYALGLKLFPKEVTDFFVKLLGGVFESRKYKESGKHDFVDLLLNWKQKDFLIGDSINRSETEKQIIQLNVDDELIIGQCVLFFAAGYETTSITMSYLLYELAKHKEIQSRVIQEVDNYYEKHNGVIDFEAINEMPYLLACIDETLRFYPVFGILTREVVENYTLPTKLQLEKGTRIHVPVHHMHRNPEYFPNPEEFRPERFMGDEKKNIKHFTYFPFGEGPRSCIGMRFAKIVMVTGLLTIFKNYKIETCEKTLSSYKVQPRSLTTQPIGGMQFKFLSRND